MLRRLFQRQPHLKVEVLGHKIDWTPEDGKTFQGFLDSPTGSKLKKVMDNQIISMAFDPDCNEEKRMGALEFYAFVVSRVSPKEKLGKNPASGEKTDDSAAGGTIIFPVRKVK